MEALIQAEMATQQTVQAPHPDWLPGLVTHRDCFAGTALFSMSASPDADVVFKFILAMHQPYRAVFLECKRRPRIPMAFLQYGDYQYESFKFVDHAAVPWTSLSDIMVYGDCLVVGEHVHTLGDPVPWSEFTRYHLRRTAAPRSNTTTDSRSRKPTDPEVLRLLQLEYPWLSIEELQELLCKKVQQVGSGAGGSSSSHGVSAPQASDLPEDVAASVAAELSSLREEVGHGSSVGHFTVKVLGGDWSVTRFHKGATDIGVYPKDKATGNWCKGVGWPPSPGQKSFSVSKFGTENARQLASEMCRLANYYITSWIERGSPGGFDFEGLKGAYVPSLEYQAWVDSLPLNSDAFKAAVVIRKLCPLPVPQ